MALQLIILGLAITLEPLTLVGFILILATTRGVWKGLAFILGWLATLVAVVAATLVATQGNPPRPATVPSTAALVVKALLGVVLIWVAFREQRHLHQPRKEPNWMARLDRLSLAAAAGLGVFLQPWSLVAAGAATVVQADLSTASSWFALVLFCLLATSSFLVLELYTVFAPQAAGERLARVRTWINAHTTQAIVLLSLVVGCWLLGDSIYLIVSAA